MPDRLGPWHPPASAKADDPIDFNALFKHSPIPTVVLKKTNGRIVLACHNRSASEILGNLSPEGINGSIERIFADSPELIDLLTTCFNAKRTVSREWLYRNHSHQTHRSLKLVVTYLDVDLRVVHLENIHKQRQAEADLRKSKERLELAIDATDSGLWDWHLPSGEVIFGEQWAAILGYAIDEIEPHISTWQRLLHPADKPQVTRKLERHLSGELPRYESEHRLRGKNGNWVWVLDVGKVVERDAQNAPLRMTGTKVDISGRKKMEAGLERLNAELEKRIEQRTRKLKQSQRSLIRSQTHLRRKSKHLQEVNSALKILLKKSAENKKEIAALLCLSGKTIETQRRSIRKKLGLNGRKINLKTYLDEMLQ